jgi:hypothetical protein
MSKLEKQEPLRASILKVTEYGEVYLSFSKAILLPPNSPGFVPSNKIANLSIL